MVDRAQGLDDHKIEATTLVMVRSLNPVISGILAREEINTHFWSVFISVIPYQMVKTTSEGSARHLS